VYIGYALRGLAGQARNIEELRFPPPGIEEVLDASGKRLA
jgi:hypothetical protein